MFWIIGSTEKMPATTTADIKRLSGNVNVKGEVARPLYEHSRKQVASVLDPAVGEHEPIFLLAHAGYADREKHDGRQPWIGGLWLDELTDSMVTKFTAEGLSGRKLWALVCHVGGDLTTFAELLSKGGVRNTNIYMPTDFMYISARGIPHILSGYDDVDAANKDVAKYDADYMSLTSSRESGDGWAGVAIDADGAVSKIGAGLVKTSVLKAFDPEGDGED